MPRRSSSEPAVNPASKPHLTCDHAPLGLVQVAGNHVPHAGPPKDHKPPGDLTGLKRNQLKKKEQKRSFVVELRCLSARTEVHEGRQEGSRANRKGREAERRNAGLCSSELPSFSLGSRRHTLFIRPGRTPTFPPRCVHVTWEKWETSEVSQPRLLTRNISHSPRFFSFLFLV